MADDEHELIVTPLKKAKKKVNFTDVEKKTNKGNPAIFNDELFDDQYEQPEADKIDSFGDEDGTITFHNTNNYNKYIKARGDREDPEF